MTARLIFLLSLFFAPHKTPPTHGTINVLLANRNGVVLVTDSRASDQQGRKVHDRSQKLFKIDDATVCSTAGFGADPGPGDTIRETVTGEIQSIVDGLAKSSGPMSFRHKIEVFTSTLKAQLVNLETDYEYAQKAPGTPSHSKQDLILLFAGYDKEGTAIAKVVITVNPTQTIDSHRIFEGSVHTEFKPVVKDLVYFTAGVDDTVKYRLQSPAAFDTEAELNDYRNAVRDGKTANLRVEQLESLARYLEKDASGYPVVGGPVQIAKIVDKQVQVDLPPNLIKSGPPYRTGFIFFNRFSDMPLFLMINPRNNHSVFVNNDCENAAMLLDDQVYIGGEYVNCNFFYDGGDFYRDPSVKITGGQLILGPHVSLDSFFAKKAENSLPELKPRSVTTFPNGETLAKQIWGTGEQQ